MVRLAVFTLAMTTMNYQKVLPGDGCSKDLESGTFAGVPTPPAADYSKGDAEFELDAVSTQFTATARLGFVRKVFGLLTVQLLMTVAMSALFMENVAIRNYVVASPGLLTLSFVGSIGCIFLCSANKDSHPKNLYCLAAFTFFESLTIGFICALYAATASAAATGPLFRRASVGR